jgi:hypothetical protein
VIRCLVRADAMRAALPIKLVFTWGMTLARFGELHRVPELLYFRNIRQEGLSYTLRQRPAEELWQDSLDWALGVVENVHPLISEDDHLYLFCYVVNKLINEHLQKNWLYDFTQADRTMRLKFVREVISATRARFNLSPYRDMKMDLAARSFLRSRRDRVGILAGEELIIDAILSTPVETPTNR